MVIFQYPFLSEEAVSKLLAFSKPLDDTGFPSFFLLDPVFHLVLYSFHQKENSIIT
jgi:hypothetical protein